MASTGSTAPEPQKPSEPKSWKNLLSGTRGRLRQAGAWVRAHKWRVLVLAIVLSVPLIQTWVLGVLRLPQPPQAYVDAAYQALEQGDWQGAYRVLERTPRVYTYPGPWRRDFLLIQAAVAYYRAGETEPDPKPAYRKALRLLRQAQAEGFPPQWHDRAMKWLAETYFQLEQYAQALATVQALVGQERADPEVLLLGAEAALRVYPPRVQAAQTLLQQAAAQPLRPSQQARWHLWQAVCLFHQGQLDQVEKHLQESPRTGSLGALAALVRGQSLFKKAQALPRPDPQRKLLLEQAEAAFKQALKLDLSGQRVADVALYELGRTLLEQGRTREAIATWFHLREQYSDQVVTVAAAWQLAQVFLQNHQLQDALDQWSEMAQGHQLLDQPNPYLSRSQAVDELVSAWNQLVAKGQYTWAVRLLEVGEPVLGTAEALLRRAQTFRRWAQALLSQHPPSALPTAKPSPAQLRFYQAGMAWARLAALQYDQPQYLEYLWNAIEDLLRCRRYDLVLRLLRVYRHQADPNPRPVDTAVAEATCHLAMDQPNKALKVLRQALQEAGAHPLIFQARLLAAECYVQLDRWQEAQKMLEENLYGGQLTPRSVEWRRSLFRLGWLHYVQQQWEGAILRLEEAVARYPQAPEALRARYQLALAYYHNARRQRAVIDGLQLASGRETATRKLILQLRRARDHFTLVLDHLHQHRNPSRPDPENELIYLNSLFLLGQIQRELGQTEESIATYLELTRVFGSWPAVLEAYVQLSEVYERSGRFREAKAAIAQAQRALKQLPEDAPLRQQTGRTRQQWADYLRWHLQNIP